VKLVFVTVVTSANIKSIDELIRCGLDLGVTVFNLRQVFYYPGSEIVDHSQMTTLLVPNDEFAEMCAEMRAKYGKFAAFDIQYAQAMMADAEPIRIASLLPVPPIRATNPGSYRADSTIEPVRLGSRKMGRGSPGGDASPIDALATGREGADPRLTTGSAARI
jgi:hypothetical protein